MLDLFLEYVKKSSESRVQLFDQPEKLNMLELPGQCTVISHTDSVITSIKLTEISSCSTLNDCRMRKRAN